MPLIMRQFTYTGAIQTVTIPNFVTEVLIKAWGAGAGGGGGPGGYATGRIPVVTGDTLTMTVGQGGQTNQTTSTFGGGGGTTANPFDPTIVGSSGGGASYLYKNISTLLLVAGGGGGGGSAGGFSYGGSGGGTTGTTAPSIGTTNTGGGGGTQGVGGAGGVNVNNTALNGTSGASFQGGKGGGTNGTNTGTAGGGGGGYFGGGGGAGQAVAGQQETAGGGGSSYIAGVLGGTTLSTPQNTTGAAASFLPPNTTDTSYITGVGVGKAFAGFGLITVGGNGLIVLSYTLPDLVLTKIVSKAYANLNETLVYTIGIRNTGPATVTGITFVDTTPNGTTFQSGSLTIDLVPSANNPNPPGFSIASLGPGITTTISYSVKVGAVLPSPNPIPNNAAASYTGSSSYASNTVSTVINHATLASTKTVDKNYAEIGDTLTYTVVLKNSGSTTATPLRFSDTIPNGTTLIGGTFRQDGTLVTGTPSPPGVTLPNSIGINGVSTVIFQVKVTALPIPNPIPNTAQTNYQYTVDPSTTPIQTASSTTVTNTVTTQINTANLTAATKSVSKNFAACGDTLTYTIVIPNTGSTTAQNILLKDTIPIGTTFVANSVWINGNRQNDVRPDTGITLPNIAAGATATVTFDVIVQC